MALPRNKILTIIVILVLLGFAISAAMRMIGRNVGETVMERMIEQQTGNDADVKFSGDKMQVTTDEGTFTTGNKAPDNWPEDAPIYAGATIQYSASATPQAGSHGSAMVLETTDDAKTVSAFYKTAMTAHGWTVENTMESGGSMVLIGTKGDRTFSIAVSQTGETTGITLAVETKSE